MTWKISSIHTSLVMLLVVINPFFALGICAAADQALLYKGRIWQKIGSGKMLNWYDANQYCQNLTLNGYADWRLPSQQEMAELEVCTDVPRLKSSSSQKAEDIVIGVPGKECNEDLKYAGGGRINQAFKLHMTKEDDVWQSRYWTNTSGFARKSISSKVQKMHDGYFYYPFLWDSLMSKCSPPSELNFVRCVRDQEK